MAKIRGLLEPQLPSLYRYALALTRDASQAEDLVQTCIVRTLANQDQWAEGANLQSWLFTILHNVFVSQLRRNARERAWRADADFDTAPIPGSDPELWCRIGELQTALGKLSNAHREIILRLGLQRDTYEGIAEALRIPLGTVRSRLSGGAEVAYSGRGGAGNATGPVACDPKSASGCQWKTSDAEHRGVANPAARRSQRVAIGRR